jgi:hypothetical protein
MLALFPFSDTVVVVTDLCVEERPPGPRDAHVAACGPDAAMAWRELDMPSIASLPGSSARAETERAICCYDQSLVRCVA